MKFSVWWWWLISKYEIWCDNYFILCLVKLNVWKTGWLAIWSTTWLTEIVHDDQAHAGMHTHTFTQPQSLRAYDSNISSSHVIFITINHFVFICEIIIKCVMMLRQLVCARMHSWSSLRQFNISNWALNWAQSEVFSWDHFNSVQFSLSSSRKTHTHRLTHACATRLGFFSSTLPLLSHLWAIFLTGIVY